MPALAQVLAPAPPHEPGMVLFFALIGPAVAALAVTLVVRAMPALRWRAPLLAAAWLALTGVAARAGFMARLDLTPPPAALLIGAAITLALLIGLSPLGRQLAERVPLTHLIGLQAFRWSLEMGMHRAFELHIMPEALTWSGSNLDVISGLTAAVIAVGMALGVRVPVWLVWVWNVWGLVCLAVIAALAVLLSPMVHALGSAPSQVNTWVLFFPYVWLPSVLVPVALAGHVVITRQLLAGRAR